jgi:hypothetical protein
MRPSQFHILLGCGTRQTSRFTLADIIGLRMCSYVELRLTVLYWPTLLSRHAQLSGTRLAVSHWTTLLSRHAPLSGTTMGAKIIAHRPPKVLNFEIL